FAVQDSDAEDDVPGRGNGFIDTFSVDGSLMAHFASQGNLDSPWGIALAPDDFGGFSGTVLVGNFGNGEIIGFDPSTGTPLGRLKDKNKQKISIEGLWGIAFPPKSGGGRDLLLFASGPEGESHGLLGRLRPRGKD